MRLKALLYRVNHGQILPLGQTLEERDKLRDEITHLLALKSAHKLNGEQQLVLHQKQKILAQEEDNLSDDDLLSLRSLYGLLHRMDVDIGMKGPRLREDEKNDTNQWKWLNFFQENHRDFAQTLRTKIEKVFNLEIYAERHDLKTQQHEESILRSYVMRSCLKLHVDDKIKKRDKLITRLNSIEQRLLEAIDSDKADLKSRLKVNFQLDSMYKEQRDKLIDIIDTIRANINFTYNLRDITNADMDYLHYSVENVIKQLRLEVSSMYQYGVSKVNNKFPEDVSSNQINNMPQHTNKLFYDEFPKFLHHLQYNLRFRFDPLLMAKNEVFISGEKNDPTEFEKKLKKGVRRQDDDYHVFQNTIRLNKRQIAYTSSGRGDRKNQEDRVGVSFYQVEKKISPEQIADMMYEAIQHHADEHKDAFSVGSTLNWTALHDGKVINANVGDSKSFLITRSTKSNDEGEVEEEIQVQALNWGHSPSHINEIHRFDKLGIDIDKKSHRIGKNGINMSRAIGDHGYDGKGLTGEPDFTITELRNGQEAYVITVSDGVTNTMSRQDIEDFLKQNGVEGNVADALRREAYKRYTLNPKTLDALVPADNISVAYSPVVHDDQQLVFTCVEDGHAGDYVADRIHENFDKYMLEAAKLHHHRLIPGVMSSDIRQNVELSLMGQLDEAISMAGLHYNEPLKKALENFKKKIEAKVGAKGRLEDVESYQKSDMITLVNRVIDAVQAAYDEDVPMEEYKRRLEDLNTVTSLTRDQKLKRAALLIGAFLAGMVIGAAVLMSMSGGTFVFISPWIEHAMTISSSLVGAGVSMGVVRFGIHVQPKEQRRLAAGKIYDSLDKPMAGG